MSKAAAPAAPNPTATAAAQEGTNVGTAVAQQTLNNTNQVTPYGSTNYSQTGGYTDPQSGQFVPSYTESTSLDPSLQSVLSGTENAANTLVPTVNTLAGQANTTATNPLNVNTTNNATIAAGPQALDQPVAQAAYGASTDFLTPQFQQQQEDLQDQLSRQGISVGNQGYGNAENQLENTQNAALVGAANNATVTGANQANNMYNLALQGQSQNIAQQQAVQQNPLQLLSQIYGGTSPTQASGAV
jgi:hypothetical protein